MAKKKTKPPEIKVKIQIVQYDEVYHLLQIVGKPLPFEFRDYIQGDYLLIKHEDDRQLSNAELNHFLESIVATGPIDWNGIFVEKMQAEDIASIEYESNKRQRKMWITIRSNQQDEKSLLHYLYGKVRESDQSK